MDLPNTPAENFPYYARVGGNGLIVKERVESRLAAIPAADVAIHLRPMRETPATHTVHRIVPLQPRLSRCCAWAIETMEEGLSWYGR